MAVRQIKSDIYAVGAIDWERRLFDKLIPLPHGTSYNSYLIMGSEKIALIDTVYPAKMQDLLRNLDKLGIKKLDYVVANHAEQDHTGSLAKVLELYPEAMVLTNKKCKEFIIDHHHISEDKFIEVDDSTEVSLGDKTLKFIIAPWVHWPDTMFTHVPEDKILFTCDFMGSHLAASKLFANGDGIVYEAAKRYFAEIMMPFKSHVKKYLAKIREMDLELIAPSHGPVYNDINYIVSAHEDWVSEDIKDVVMVPYISMYESTTKMVKYLVDALIEKGMKVFPYDLSESDLGELAITLVDADTIVFGASMVLSEPHPNAIYAASIINSLRPKAKFVSAVGSYGWAAKIGEQMGEKLKNLMPNVRAEMIQPVFTKGLPREETYKELDRLAEDIYQKHQEAKKLAETAV